MMGSQTFGLIANDPCGLSALDDPYEQLTLCRDLAVDLRFVIPEDRSSLEIGH